MEEKLITSYKRGIMSWYDYYKLLKKYAGDLSKATQDEILEVLIKNNFDPNEAMKLAREFYNEEQAKQRRI